MEDRHVSIKINDQVV
jgi:retron-type reverse transcriptase